MESRLTRNERASIAKVCPGQQQNPRPQGERDDLLWGSYQEVYEGWANDKDIRFEAASGGALTGLLAWMLNTGRVDSVLSTAEDPDNPLGNRTVFSHDREDLLAQAASRYAPSAPLLDVPHLLSGKKRFAFVGKPCDVSGLRNWARLDDRVDRVFPVKLSFFCAGVPAQEGAENLVFQMGARPSEVTRFRYRGRGWPGQSSLETKAGRTSTLSYSKSWGDVLSKHVQPRCKICADGIGLEADIAFADAWEVDADGYPLFEEQDGRSLILARSREGARLIAEAAQDGALSILPKQISSIANMQPGQLRRRRELLARLIGRLLAGFPAPRYRRLGIWLNARELGFGRALRVALGMMRRSALRRSALRRGDKNSA